MKIIKDKLRQEIRKKRQLISNEDRLDCEQKIYTHLTQNREFQSAQKILLYHSMAEEVNTTELLEQFIDKKFLILPRVENEKLVLHHISSFHHIQKGYLGIAEPVLDRPIVDPSEVELAIIPGLGFDKTGHRLGMGGGFYDRLLNQITCPIIALAYDCQIIEYVPREAHDHPVNMIITEKEIIHTDVHLT